MKRRATRRHPASAPAYLRMGFLPDAEDRVRRLELAVAQLANDMASEIECRLDLVERVEAIEKRMGAIAPTAFRRNAA